MLSTGHTHDLISGVGCTPPPVSLLRAGQAQRVVHAGPQAGGGTSRPSGGLVCSEWPVARLGKHLPGSAAMCGDRSWTVCSGRQVAMCT
ncbi:hypothetical protein HaLaN_02007 [Haematococcus lacustris]|uniref:Uncharacterized protein n=1 Tax=Haematococcus lacustris TaxID=44745 RepID=A0A699YW17_HAELA|nr:hypothetical protein HaLaN_02007 [Haematococcus lacustris]